MIDPTETLEKEFMPCPSCEGIGYYDVGDSEDGIIDECGECHGTGYIEEH